MVTSKPNYDVVKELIKDFKPSLLFLGKFLLLYFAGNIIYASYVESFDSTADDLTLSVTHQTGWLLDAIGYKTVVAPFMNDPKVAIEHGGRRILSVFEGCNGINVMIVFMAFLFAFGGPVKKMLIFLGVGLLIIHLSNLLRIVLLFILSLHDSEQFYYFHKYFFTATLYLVVFGLWAAWVIWFYEKRNIRPTA